MVDYLTFITHAPHPYRPDRDLPPKKEEKRSKPSPSEKKEKSKSAGLASVVLCGAGIIATPFTKGISLIACAPAILGCDTEQEISIDPTISIEWDMYFPPPNKEIEIRVVIAHGNDVTAEDKEKLNEYSFETDLVIEPKKEEAVAGKVKIEKDKDDPLLFLVTFPEPAFGKYAADFSITATTKVFHKGEEDGDYIDKKIAIGSITCQLKQHPLSPQIIVYVGSQGNTPSGLVGEPIPIKARMINPAPDKDNYEYTYHWTITNPEGVKVFEEINTNEFGKILPSFDDQGRYYINLEITIQNFDDEECYNSLSPYTSATLDINPGGGDPASPSMVELINVSNKSTLKIGETNKWLFQVNPKDTELFSYEYSWKIIDTTDIETEHSLKEAWEKGLLTSYSLSDAEDELECAFQIDHTFLIKASFTLTDSENNQKTYVRYSNKIPVFADGINPDKPAVAVSAPNTALGGEQITLQALINPYVPETHTYEINYKLYEIKLDNSQKLIDEKVLDETFWKTTLPKVTENTILWAEIIVSVKNEDTEKELSFPSPPVKIEVQPK